MLFGLILVIIGVLLLLQNMGLIGGNFWDYLWPIVIILIGLSFLKKKEGNGSWCNCFFHKKKKDKHKIVDEQ